VIKAADELDSAKALNDDAQNSDAEDYIKEGYAKAYQDAQDAYDAAAKASPEIAKAYQAVKEAKALNDDAQNSDAEDYIKEGYEAAYQDAQKA
ncbi:hypothetical protein LMB27_00455, partial [Limosilactobacillus reuteri]